MPREEKPASSNTRGRLDSTLRLPLFFGFYEFFFLALAAGAAPVFGKFLKGCSGGDTGFRVALLRIVHVFTRTCVFCHSRSEFNGFDRFHYLEEGGGCIGQIVHHAFLAIFAKGGFKHRHFLNEGFLGFRSIVLYKFALDPESLAIEGADLGLGIGGKLVSGISLAKGHYVDSVFEDHHCPIGTDAWLISFDRRQIERSRTLQEFEYFVDGFHNWSSCYQGKDTLNILKSVYPRQN